MKKFFILLFLGFLFAALFQGILGLNWIVSILLTIAVIYIFNFLQMTMFDNKNFVRRKAKKNHNRKNRPHVTLYHNTVLFITSSFHKLDGLKAFNNDSCYFEVGSFYLVFLLNWHHAYYPQGVKEEFDFIFRNFIQDFNESLNINTKPILKNRMSQYLELKVPSETLDGFNLTNEFDILNALLLYTKDNKKPQIRDFEELFINHDQEKLELDIAIKTFFQEFKNTILPQFEQYYTIKDAFGNL